jgi:signal transduction histidine kinase
MDIDQSAESLRLRATVRDLLALSILPEAWVGREPPAIAAELADLLTGLLHLDFAFVRLCDPTGGRVVEVTRGSSWKAFPEWLQQHLAVFGQFSRKEIVTNVSGDDESSCGIVIPIGVNSERGFVAAASTRSNFPDQIDQQLLSVAANNAATAFQNAFLINELRSAQEALRNSEQELRKAHDELEIKVAERTSELRRRERELTRASQIATVAELSASIAHELNQPLMSVLANAQAGKRWLTANPPNLLETKASIERIIRDARAADQVIQHIRGLFKQESFEKKQASIRDVLSEAVRFVRWDPRKHDVSIDWQLDEPLPTVSVDLTQIQHVFINLISNAMEALEGSQVSPHVTVRASATDQNQMLIQVIDNGPGLADQEGIFDAFVTTKANGMGIGLAVSRSIVEAHGGRLWAENNPSGGATFSVALPLFAGNRIPVQLTVGRRIPTRAELSDLRFHKQVPAVYEVTQE